MYQGRRHTEHPQRLTRATTWPKDGCADDFSSERPSSVTAFAKTLMASFAMRQPWHVEKTSEAIGTDFRARPYMALGTEASPTGYKLVRVP